MNKINNKKISKCPLGWHSRLFTLHGRHTFADDARGSATPL